MRAFHFAKTDSVARRIAGILALAALCQVYLQPQTPTTEYIRAGGRVIAAIKNPPAYFTDMTGSYAQFLNEANLMYADGITSGVSAYTFDPSGTLTREQAAVFIIRSIFVALLGPGHGDSFTPGTTAYFSDVPTTYMYYPWIQEMHNLGITAGCAGTTYCPTTTMTNDNMAIFAIRARQYVLTGSVSGFYVPPTALFADVSSSYTYYTWINAIGGLGVVVPATGGFGCTATNFCPNTTLLRGPATSYVVHGILNDWSY